jgi:hypothetical protein
LGHGGRIVTAVVGDVEADGDPILEEETVHPPTSRARTSNDTCSLMSG